MLSRCCPSKRDEGQTDSSVAPFALQFPPTLRSNYNFAIARVRLRGSSGPTGAAIECAGVLPRLRQPEPRHGLRSERHVRLHSGPCRPSRDAAAGGGPDDRAVLCDRATRHQRPTTKPTVPTIQTLTIPAGQDQTYAYYGCFLNFYDPANTVGGQQVQTLFPGTHHCIVAQIAYDDAPIPSGVSPMSGTSSLSGTCSSRSSTTRDPPRPTGHHRRSTSGPAAGSPQDAWSGCRRTN